MDMICSLYLVNKFHISHSNNNTFLFLLSEVISTTQNLSFYVHYATEYSYLFLCLKRLRKTRMDKHVKKDWYCHWFLFLLKKIYSVIFHH